jgi:hypothetical protein
MATATSAAAPTLVISSRWRARSSFTRPPATATFGNDASPSATIAARSNATRKGRAAFAASAAVAPSTAPDGGDAVTFDGALANGPGALGLLSLAKSLPP